MKKLTSLQILMVLGLGLNASTILSNEAINEQDMSEAVAAELDSAQAEAARLEVLTDLAELYPMQVERIITDEADLESTFNSIRNFINKKNTEIENLLQQNNVSEAEVARLAVELADAQSELNNTIAKQRAKHKKSHKQEQPIKDAFMKAGKNLKSLNSKNVRGFNDSGNAVQQKLTKKQKAKKAARAEQPMLMDSADEAIAMMDDQMMNDEVVVQSTSKKSSSSSSKKQQSKQPKKKSKKS
jgi:hypothetical protein